MHMRLLCSTCDGCAGLLRRHAPRPEVPHRLVPRQPSQEPRPPANRFSHAPLPGSTCVPHHGPPSHSTRHVRRRRPLSLRGAQFSRCSPRCTCARVSVSSMRWRLSPATRSPQRSRRTTSSLVHCFPVLALSSSAQVRAALVPPLFCPLERIPIFRTFSTQVVTRTLSLFGRAMRGDVHAE